jgi:hypothetical protein
MQVYRIFNKVNGKSYIGITKWDFNTRYNGGKWWLWSHNKHLKIASKKYGLDNFGHEILWEGQCSEEELFNLEKLYIEQYQSFIPNGYNLTTGGGRIYTDNHKEYELIDFSGTLYKVSNLSEFSQLNRLNYTAMLNLVCGFSHTSQGFALATTDLSKFKNPNQEFYLQHEETKEICLIKRKGLLAWSKERSLSSRKMHQVIKGRIKRSCGWKLLETSEHTKQKRIINQKFINPDGKEVVIENIYQFCKDNKLERSGFYDLVNGKALVYKGYRLPMSDEELKQAQEKKLGKSIELIDPAGNIIQVKNVSAFCRSKNFNRNSIDAMLSGRTKEFHGYKLKK